MLSFFALSHNAARRAAQLFITIIIILLLGKLITLVPMMEQLKIADTFNAAEIIWFFAKLSALIVFFLFARYAIEAIPNKGGALSFVRGVAEPITVLLIIILGQGLLWQMLDPFVGGEGKTIYYSAITIVIVCVSIWLVLTAYRDSLYIVDSMRKMSGVLSRFVPQQQIICQQCHAEVASNAAFCDHCGYKMHTPLCCSECGEATTEGQSYCQHCGVKLSEETSPKE